VNRPLGNGGLERSSPPVVLVSKPLGPPWADGSSRLVGELVEALAAEDPGVTLRYEIHTKGGYAPSGTSIAAVPWDASGRLSNLRMTARLLRRRGAAVFAFFFAPHPPAVLVASVVSRLAGATPVQVVCSQPRSFRSARKLCFGWRVVALSPWTRERLVASGVDESRVVVVPPPLRPLERPSTERLEQARATLELDRGKRVVLFPGDAEPGGGLQTLAEAIPKVLRRVPETVVVIACRPKTPRAAEEVDRARRTLTRAGALAAVRFAGAVDDFHALLAVSDLCVLPASTLYAKVDYPYALLEAMSLGAPVVVGQGTAIGDLIEREGGGRAVPSRAPRALAGAMCELLDSGERLAERGAEARSLVSGLCDPVAIAEQYEELFEGAERASLR
jgi:glycosyltransferase involved in cell wall biosynthesis